MNIKQIITPSKKEFEEEIWGKTIRTVEAIEGGIKLYESRKGKFTGNIKKIYGEVIFETLRLLLPEKYLGYIPRITGNLIDQLSREELIDILTERNTSSFEFYVKDLIKQMNEEAKNQKKE